MKIKILKDEFLLTNRGTHICDDQGIALLADDDTECEIDDDVLATVKEIITFNRSLRGLDEHGTALPTEVKMTADEMLAQVIAEQAEAMTLAEQEAAKIQEQLNNTDSE